MGQIYTLLHSAIQSRESKETVARGATAPNTSAWLRHTEEPAAKVIRAPQSRDATKNRTLYTIHDTIQLMNSERAILFNS